MEEENASIYDIIGQSDVYVEKVFGLDSNLFFSDINRYYYKKKYSLLVLKNQYIFNSDASEARNKLLEVEVQSIINNLE